jgi:hypothetical protein
MIKEAGKMASFDHLLQDFYSFKVLQIEVPWLRF